MKEAVILWLLFSLTFQSKAQPSNCEFKNPLITIHFGSGTVRDLNSNSLSGYERVRSSCPSDGYYTYTASTSDCFGGDWQTLPEDHTPGDADGNMLLVNSSDNPGTFFRTAVSGLKGGTTYEFAVWMMNVCRISDKCPFPLLPNITIRLQTEGGKIVARFNTGEVMRREAPRWTRYQAVFVTPPSETTLVLVMTNNKPGGCGNDFAMDDITFRECVKPPPIVKPKPKPAVVTKKQTVTAKPAVKKTTPVKSGPKIGPIIKPQKDSALSSIPVLKRKPVVLPPPPAALRTRTNALVKQIETETGEIRIDLYDNGEIDGDTVSIYHNNTLLVAHARLTQKPVTFRIAVDANHPHHELVMVAENLGSIPPNTSLMFITAGSKRYQVFISSTEQKNAKVILSLKE